MAKHKYDVVATVGKYEKNGETKYISRKVGAAPGYPVMGMVMAP